MPPFTSHFRPEQFATFGELLRYLRRRAGLTQTELSIAVGYSPPQISRLENNQRVPDLASLHARFVPALHLEREPATIQRLADLAKAQQAPPHATGQQARHNLPAHLTSFVGREREIAQVQRLLERSRLVTLTGAGGSGKTRLALQAAERAAPDYPDGVWLVELASLVEGGLLPDKIAAALRLRGRPDQSLQDSLVEYLEGRSLLLVLDNCEHLVAACAALAKRLLEACPELRVLATSREALGVAGEAAWRLPPLSLPDMRETQSVDAVAGSEAVQLFVQRAQAVEAGFALTPQNAAAVVKICRRLDGMPLPLELAASRVPMLGVDDLAGWLVQRSRFELLTSGSRTAPARHQTLAAMLGWSYDLLPEPERACLRRLAVFAGGWTLEAAEAVCGDDAAGVVLHLLAQLVNKSLVDVQPAPGESRRYRLLETIRAFALERLSESGHELRARRRHARYFMELGEAAEPRLLRTGKAAWLERLYLEQDNFQAALEWAAEHEDEVSHRIIGALFWLCYHRGTFGADRRWFEHIAGRLTADRHRAARGRALWAAGTCARVQGDLAGALALMEESIVLHRAVGGQSGLGLALADLGRIEISLGRADAAQQHLAEAVRTFSAAGDRWGVGLALSHWGSAAATAGRHEEAVALYTESAAEFRSLDERGALAVSLGYLGFQACRRGDTAAAREIFAECFAAWQDMTDPFDTGWGLEGLGWMALVEGQAEHAVRLFGASTGILAAIDVRADWSLREHYETNVEAARAALGESAFARAWAEGSAMSREQAIEYALQYLNPDDRL